MSDVDAPGAAAAAPATLAEPPVFVRGAGATLWDETGHAYLDAADDTAPAGHGNAAVVEAINTQAALAAPPRTGHSLHRRLARRLAATLDGGLSEALLVASGAEANDLALRLTQAATGRRGIVAVAGAAHGQTALLAQLSAPHPGGAAQFRIVPAPDPARAGAADLDEQARRFAREVALAIADLEDTGQGFAALILCPAFVAQGLPAIPTGFLAPTQALVRRAGGLMIADESQAGFGRLGSHFWAHAWLGLAPDAVTLGEAMANGFPAGAVLTRPEIVAALRDSGGPAPRPANPIAAAAALATLDAIARQDLQHNAAETGARLAGRLGAVSHPAVAPVRGAGLLRAVEVGTPDLAARLVAAMRAEGVLAALAGPGRNVVILRPPLTLTRAEADRIAAAFTRALATVG